ncbi:MAG: SPOR domain-containing protein [Ignavibacteriales bacterium]|nr:SPOR domain-containing protein [Ignavibacteriales bacterium]
MKLKIYLLIFAALLFAYACVPVEEETQEPPQETPPPEEEVYVFEEEPIEEPVVEQPVFQYTVQIGAFTTRDRAEKFILECKGKINQPLQVVFKNNVNLYAVQLSPFSDRSQADLMVSQLKSDPKFFDTFIIMDRIK